MHRHRVGQGNSMWIVDPLSLFGWQLTYYSLRIIMQMSQALLILMSLFFLLSKSKLMLHRLKQLDEKRLIVVWGVAVAFYREEKEKERERQHKLTLSAAIKGFVRVANKKRQRGTNKLRGRGSETCLLIAANELTT